MSTTNHLHEEHKVDPSPMPKSAMKNGAPTIGELVAKITAQFSALIRDEIKYAAAQAKTKATKLGTAGALFAVAGILALYMLGILLLAAGFGLANVVSTWLAFLIVAGGLLVIILILALVAMSKIKSSKQNIVDPKAGINKDVDAVKKGMNK
ncbi:phage holin family protein [Arcanobacterium ihumii]|uniref:phage holin family protein n=1 Tax=Arcanobacterium ihumii TaxID=2138162 RepID=UPI000F51E7FA|nr:phage holin family protein [Arcanobacterium ihumii]